MNKTSFSELDDDFSNCLHALYNPVCSVLMKSDEMVRNDEGRKSYILVADFCQLVGKGGFQGVFTTVLKALAFAISSLEDLRKVEPRQIINTS